MGLRRESDDIVTILVSVDCGKEERKNGKKTEKELLTRRERIHERQTELPVLVFSVMFSNA